MTPFGPGDFVTLHYSDWGEQIGYVVARARDGVRWRMRKYMRQSERWTPAKLVLPGEVKAGRPPAACAWVDRALMQMQAALAARTVQGADR